MKSTTKKPLLYVALFVILIVVLISVKKTRKYPEKSQEAIRRERISDSLKVIENSKNDLIEYIVNSNRDGFNVTYFNKDGGTEQVKVKSNTWTKSFKGGFGTMVSLVAQTEHENTAIQVIIMYENKVYKQSQSDGDYVIATASGIIGM